MSSDTTACMEELRYQKKQSINKGVEQSLEEKRMEDEMASVACANSERVAPES